MNEQRKHAILFAVRIFSARKFVDADPDKRNFAREYFVDSAIAHAAFIPERIDNVDMWFSSLRTPSDTLRDCV